MKTMEYNSRFLENTSIFTTAEEDYLESLANEYSIDQLLRNRRQYENCAIDYAYVSGKIEGNQYSRKGAAMLLQYGFTEAGRTYQDAAMLVNLRDASRSIMFKRFIRRSPPSCFARKLGDRFAVALSPFRDPDIFRLQVHAHWNMRSKRCLRQPGRSPARFLKPFMCIAT